MLGWVLKFGDVGEIHTGSGWLLTWTFKTFLKHSD